MSLPDTVTCPTWKPDCGRNGRKSSMLDAPYTAVASDCRKTSSPTVATTRVTGGALDSHPASRSRSRPPMRPTMIKARMAATGQGR